MNEITFRVPDDMHVHLRQGGIMPAYARRIASDFGRAVIMPNLIPPIASPESLSAYRSEIRKAAPGLEPLMTFKLLPGMGGGEIAALKAAGAIAGKYYPEGVTTNSEDGISGTAELYPILASMEDVGLILCIHGEAVDAPVLERERVFLDQFREMVKKFPKLRMVFEHVSTAEGVEAVCELPETVAATVTVHHLMYTLEDLLASGLDAHLYCKPLVKNEDDRRAIEKVVLEGNAKFFFGSDSAPHPAADKAKTPAAAGVYSAPVALPLLIEFFDDRGMIPLLEDYTSGFGADFYGLARSTRLISWRKESWQVPDLVDGVVPLHAGKTLLWKKMTAG